jgi:DNA-binding CsgD family transcriptional regulator
MRDEHILSIANLFYDGVLSPDGWGKALKALALATGSEAGSLIVWDRQNDQAVVGEQVGLPTELSVQYAAHYHLLDPGRKLIDRTALGDWYLDERDFGADAIRRSAFYKDFLRPYALDSTMASPILRGVEGRDGFLSLSSRSGARNLHEVAQSLCRLMPHIRRAAELRSRLLALTQQSYLLHDVLDRIALPLMVVTAARTIVVANRMGEEWLAQNNPFAPHSVARDKIMAGLMRSCGKLHRHAASVAIRKPDGTEYYLNIVPMPESAYESLHPTERTALVFVMDPAQRSVPTGDLLRELFGVSSAEARLVLKLREGLTLQEAGYDLNIATATARTQLKSVFAKLGIRRQTELQRLLGRMELIDRA